MFTTQQIKKHVSWATGRKLTSHAAWDALLEFKNLAETDLELTSSLLGGVVPGKGHAANRLSGSGLQYFTRGAVDAMRLSVAIRDHHNPDEALDILDFGAGPGRLIRYFRLFWPHCRLQACDVDPDKVDFLKWATADVSGFVIPQMPPFEFKQQFDVVYAWSVWSHYNDQAALEWIKAIKKALKPGGLLVITVHTEDWLDLRKDDAELKAKFKRLGVTHKSLKDSLARDGYTFWPSYKPHREAELANFDTDTFGMSIFTREYMKESWGKELDVIDFRTASPQWQDMVVMRNG